MSWEGWAADMGTATKFTGPYPSASPLFFSVHQLAEGRSLGPHPDSLLLLSPSSVQTVQCRAHKEQFLQQSRLVFTDPPTPNAAIFKGRTSARPKRCRITISQQLGLELTTVSNFFMNARRRSPGSGRTTWARRCSSTSGNCTKVMTEGLSAGHKSPPDEDNRYPKKTQGSRLVWFLPAFTYDLSLPLSLKLFILAVNIGQVFFAHLLNGRSPRASWKLISLNWTLSSERAAKHPRNPNKSSCISHSSLVSANQD